MTTLVGIVTIAMSTYMIIYSQPIYERLASVLGVFERRQPYRELSVEHQPPSADQPQLIVFGLGRYGRRLLEQLQERGLRVLGVDFDPELVRIMQRHKLPVRFGDAEDPAFIESLPLAGAAWVVTTLPEPHVNSSLLAALKAEGITGKVAGVVRDESVGSALAEAGADRIMNPFQDGADHAAESFALEIETKA